jgi:glycosyltransferase involved in cell wall biosynthesis
MPEDGRLLVSVIVPTYNEEADIEQTMDALTALTYRPLEVLVVDDKSQDRTLEIVRGYDGRVPGLRILPQAVNRGVATSRNVGLEQASGEVAVILNADVCPEPDFVDRIVPYYVRDEVDYLVVDARVINMDTVYGRYIQARHEHDLATIDLNTLHWTEGFSCRREVALAVGGFPGEFGGASGEDIVFTERLVKGGYRRGLDFSIVVPHIAPPTFIEYWKQRIGRGRGGAYRLYAYEKRPIRWGSVARSVLGTWILNATFIPPLVWGWWLHRYSKRKLLDLLPFAWLRLVEMIARLLGYWQACQDIARQQAQVSRQPDEGLA